MKKLNYALLRLGLFCVYPLPGDGDSMTSPNGCRRRCENGKTNDCSYPTEQLEQALDVDSRNSRTKYNEVVIDRATFMCQLAARRL